MPRLRQVPKAATNAPIVTTMYDYLFEGRDPVTEPGTWSGAPGDWWTVFALVPDVLEHAVSGFALYQSPKRLLDPVLRELGQIRAGWAVGSQFVFSQHCKSLRDLGVAEEKIQSIPTGRRRLVMTRPSVSSWRTPTVSSTDTGECPMHCSLICGSA